MQQRGSHAGMSKWAHLMRDKGRGLIGMDLTSTECLELRTMASSPRTVTSMI